jgi:hypothetical protein
VLIAGVRKNCFRSALIAGVEVDCENWRVLLSATGFDGVEGTPETGYDPQETGCLAEPCQVERL